MSTGFGLLADPISVAWQEIDSHGNAHIGVEMPSRFRSAIYTFPPLTSAQYAQWISLCDIVPGTFTSFHLPRRLDATYQSDPETFTVTHPATWYGTYAMHFLGSRHSSGVYVYDTTILLYMVRSYDIGGGGG